MQGTARVKSESGSKGAVPGQALRSGRHRPLPAAVRRPPPSTEVAASGVEAHIADEAVQQARKVLLAGEASPPQQHPDQRPRSVRSTGKKRSRRDALAMNHEAETGDEAEAAVQEAEGDDQEHDAVERKQRAPDPSPARQLRSRRGTPVPAAAQMPLEGMAAGTDSDREDTRPTGVRRKRIEAPEILERPRTRRPTAKSTQQAPMSPSGGEVEAEDADESDADNDGDARCSAWRS